MLNDDVRAVIERATPLLRSSKCWQKKKVRLMRKMMYNTYNMGIGMIVAGRPGRCRQDDGSDAGSGEEPYRTGRIESVKKRSITMLRLAVLVSGGGTTCGRLLSMESLMRQSQIHRLKPLSVITRMPMH